MSTPVEQLIPCLPRPVFEIVATYTGSETVIETLDEEARNRAYGCIFDVYRDRELITRFRVTDSINAVDFKAKVMSVLSKALKLANQYCSIEPTVNNEPDLMAPLLVGEKVDDHQIQMFELAQIYRPSAVMPPAAQT